MNMCIKASAKRIPLLLKPVGKDYLWGGTRLKYEFNKEIEMTPLAETWECSTHSDGKCQIVSAPYFGMSLKDVLKAHPEFIGKSFGKKSTLDGDLPILVKLIDAKEELSVQVHPSDGYAALHENGQLGKTEMWYVLEASENAYLTYGFSQPMKKENIASSISDGTITKYLKRIPVEKDDIFCIKSGQVHAIGAGILIAEIQENSNLTYRLYDYDRIDKNGFKRELHLDRALDVVICDASEEPRQPMRTLHFFPGFATELLCQCKYFQVERMLLNTENCRKLASFKTKENSFQVFLCIRGCGNIFWENGGMINFHKGDCIFIPADSLSFKLHGNAQILKISC